MSAQLNKDESGVYFEAAHRDGSIERAYIDPGGPQWTAEVPTEYGWYWACNEDSAPYAYRILIDRFGRPFISDGFGGIIKEAKFVGWKWLGPIEEPKRPKFE